MIHSGRTICREFSHFQAVKIEKRLIVGFSGRAFPPLLRLVCNSHHQVGWMARALVCHKDAAACVSPNYCAQTGNQSHAIIELHRARRTWQPGPLLRYSSHTRAAIIATTNCPESRFSPLMTCRQSVIFELLRPRQRFRISDSSNSVYFLELLNESTLLDFKQLPTSKKYFNFKVYF